MAAIAAAVKPDLDLGIKQSDRVMAAVMSGLIVVTLSIWIAFKDESAKYILYTLPFTFTVAYLIMRRGRVKLHLPGVVALACYLAISGISMALNSWYDFFAIRDVAIIASYLYLFMLWFRGPAATADYCMFALAVGMLVEAAVEGVGEEVNLFGSQGILESTLAFPIGLVTLYYVHFRQWGRALIAAIWLFLAFKRIAFLAVPMAIGFDLVISGYVRFSVARLLAFAGVIAISIAALFSSQIFEFVAATLQIQNTSANSISLGRYGFASRIWAAQANNPALSWVFGSGPGSADAAVGVDNPHNDWLKILFDYGIFGFLVIHAILCRLLCEHRLGIMLYIYTATLMVTDNIFIYMFYHPFLLLLVSAARTQPLQAPTPSRKLRYGRR